MKEIKVIKKVYAYIVKNNQLLVFSEPDFPDIGMQIPGGTVEENENIEDALKREIFEETGLTKIKIKSYLGEDFIDLRNFGKNQIHERHFFQVELEEETNETWDHTEKFPSEGTEKEILFRFFWLSLNEKIDIGSQDKFLSVLK
ncbi:MAG: NUDIX domain-containing protein [Cyanobacteriota bacterium]